MIPIIISPTLITVITGGGGAAGLANQVSYPLYSWGVTISQPIVRTLSIADTDTVIDLAYDVQVTNTPMSLHKLSDNSNYQVTAGKTAKIILIYDPSSATNVLQVIEDASADAGTGTVKHTTPTLNTTDFATVVIDSIAASKFVTLKASTSDTGEVLSAIAIES